MSKKNRKSTVRNLQPAIVDKPAPIKVAEQVVVDQKREKQIQQRLGSINAESSKLYAELSGIQLRREKLRRAFDSASS